MSERPKIAPYLTVSPGAAAIAWYVNALGAKQKAYMPALDGVRVMHCELEINGAAVMLADAFLELGHTRSPLPGEPVIASISVEFASAQEVDDVFAKATSLGAKAGGFGKNVIHFLGGGKFNADRGNDRLAGQG